MVLLLSIRNKEPHRFYPDGGSIANISVKLKDLLCLYIFSISIIVIHRRNNPQKYVSFDLIQIIMDENILKTASVRHGIDFIMRCTESKERHVTIDFAFAYNRPKKICHIEKRYK